MAFLLKIIHLNNEKIFVDNITTFEWLKNKKNNQESDLKSFNIKSWNAWNPSLL